jgi:SAM-dependent methyltransferase
MSSGQDGYIHGTEPGEQERLAGLNRLTNQTFVEFLGVEPGMRVLEVGSGLGLLAAAVASAAPDVEVVGVERSADQIAAAARHPAVRTIRGDAHDLVFPDDTFDLVYARYVLEHVAEPGRVLAEMRRVVRPGGRVVACENDISLMRVDPPCPAFEAVWSAFARHQKSLGGDAFVGRRLFRLFHHAGLSRIELSVQPEVHWQGTPGFVPWIRNTIGNIESGRRGLAQAGLSSESEIAAAIAELSSVLERPDASSVFVWNRACGSK